MLRSPSQPRSLARISGADSMFGREKMPTVLMSGIEQEFLVAFGAENGAVDDVDFVAERDGGVGNAVDGLLVQHAIADDSAFSDLFASDFELRFHKND